MTRDEKLDRLRELFPAPYTVGETQQDFIRNTATVELRLTARVPVSLDLPDAGTGAVGVVDTAILRELQSVVSKLEFGGRRYLLTLAEGDDDDTA